MTYSLIIQWFWNFAQSTAVVLPCSVKIFKPIGQIKQVLRTNEILRDLSLRWVSDGYPIFQQPPGHHNCMEWVHAFLHHFPYCPVQKAIHGAIQCRCLYLGTNMLLLICKGVKSNNISVMVYNISYTLSREYRVVRKRYSRLLFMNDLHVQNNRRIWRHNASTPRSRDVTDHLWWCHNAKLEKTVPSDNGEINNR